MDVMVLNVKREYKWNFMNIFTRCINDKISIDVTTIIVYLIMKTNKVRSKVEE